MTAGEVLVCTVADLEEWFRQMRVQAERARRPPAGYVWLSGQAARFALLGLASRSRARLRRCRQWCGRLCDRCILSESELVEAAGGLVPARRLLEGAPASTRIDAAVGARALADLAFALGEEP